jgi:hypothetical protein
VQQVSEAKENANQLGWPFTCASGEPPIGLWFLARSHARLVVLGEDLTDELSLRMRTPTLSKMALK